MSLQYVTRVSYENEAAQNKERDAHSSSWNWSAGEVHIAEFKEYQDINPPQTLCGLSVYYQHITGSGTPAGFQWASGASSERKCGVCTAKLNGRELSDRARGRIPDWNEKRSWWK